VGRVSDCADIDVLNTLDGFNLQPRISIPFSGPIDVSTVSSQTVFLVGLGDVATGRGGHRIIGINQIVWDVATNTLHVESDALLDQHARYALIITRGVHDEFGTPVGSRDFQRFLLGLDFRQARDPELRAYRKALLVALARALLAGVRLHDVVAASVFTTQSVTAVLEKIRDQIKAATPAPADFLLGPAGARTVFPMNTVTGLTFDRHVGTGPTGGIFDQPPVFFFGVQGLIPGVVGTMAFGKYTAPDYRVPLGTPGGTNFIPPVGTRTGTPAVMFTKPVFFDLYLPAGTVPAGGWPVAIFGHGFEANRHQTIVTAAAKLAEHGIATIAINAPGHGGGSLGTLTVHLAGGGSMTFPAGGRGVDGNADGIIGPSEGFFTRPPRTILNSRDPERQLVADLMQLVRVIEVGMDVDGDGVRDLDPGRIYYFGISQGAMYGTPFVALDPSVLAGVLNVGGGPAAESPRLSIRRDRTGAALAARTPSLTNVGGIEFDENMPFRNEPPRINTVEGAMAIQEWFDRGEWARHAVDPVAWAPYLRKTPLPGGPKPVILQFARGDQEVPNPYNTAMIRAGDLADRTTFFRNDLAVADDPTLPKDGHLFMVRTFNSPANPPAAARPIALAAQEQIALFFATDRTLTIDPDDVLDPPGPAPGWFEVPIVPPLPEDLGFIE
jgi:hypothetical protein